MNRAAALAAMGEIDLGECARIAEGLIATVENLAAKKISARAAQVATAHFLACLDQIPIPHDDLYEPTHLLATVCRIWSKLHDLQGCDGDVVVARAWRTIALNVVEELVRPALKRLEVR